MARPNKYNLQYFPLDVNFFEDHKTLMIEEDYGFKGGYIAIRLLAMVYEQGYYLDWKNKQEISIAKRIGNGFTSTLVMDVLKSCLKHSLFDKKMFDQHMVLTSSGIQKRWLLVMTQLRRKVDVNSEVWLIDSEERRITSEETMLPDTFSTQKETKLKEIKLNESEVLAPTAPTHKKNNNSFIPPTINQVEIYFLSTIGNKKNPGCWPADKCRNEASAFVDHYLANGWVQARGKQIKNWQASCRTWVRNEIQGKFKNETPKGNRYAQAALQENTPTIDKIHTEIKYLYERFLDEQVTVISVDPVHYDYLKKSSLISFSQAEKEGIEALAIQHLKERSLASDGDNLIKFMKRFGVIEYFKKLKTKAVAGAQ